MVGKMPEGFILIFLLFIVIAVVVGIAQKKAAEARMAALGALASRHKLSFFPGVMSSQVEGGFFAQLFSDGSNSTSGRFLAWFQGLHPFGKGHSPEVRNLIYGEEGDIYWVVFDYSYKETHSDGKTTSTSTYPFSVVCARVKVSLPRIDLTPENIFLRIGNKLGMHELNFESEEFNRRYFVRSEQEKETYDILHPKSIDYLLRQPVRHWQIVGPQILLVESRYADPIVMEEMMAEIAGFVALLPNYVKEDHGFTAKWESPL